MLFYYLTVVGLVMPRHHLMMISVAGTITVVKLIGFATLMWAFLRWPMGQTRRFFPALTFGLFLIYYAVQMASALVRGSPGIDGGDFPKLLSIITLLIITYLMIDTPERLRHALMATTAIVTVSSYYVYSQYFIFSAKYGSTRTFGGVAGDANYHALTVIVWTPVCIYLMTTSRSKAQRALWCACLILMLGGFGLVASRGGLLGLGVALAYLSVVSRYRIRMLALTMVLAAPAIMLLPSSPMQRMLHPTQSDRTAADSRLVLWRSAWRLFKQSPVVGVGATGFAKKLQEHQDRKLDFQFSAVHNTLLECLATWGLLGTIPFVCFYGSLFRRLGRVVRMNANGPGEFGWMARVMQASLLAYWTDSMFLSTWGHMSVWALVFPSLCMIRMADDEVKSTAPGEEAPAAAGWAGGGYGRIVHRRWNFLSSPFSTRERS